MPIFKSKHIDKSLDVVDKLVVDKDKKAEIASEIVENELNSSSWFVRSARPMIVYVGLLVIILEVFGVRLHILGEAEGKIKASNAIFEYFLMTWSGVISIYIGGRSYEKAKIRQLKKAHKK